MAAADGPSAGLCHLSRARLDELLAELLERIRDVLDTQERLRGLLDAVVAIASDLSLDRVLQSIVTVACTLSDAQYGALGVLGSGEHRRLRQFVTYGMSDEQRRAIGPLPVGMGILGLIIDQPEPLRLPVLGDHPLAHGFPAHHPAMTSFLGVPIRIRDTVFGNLYLTEKRGGAPFTEEDEQTVVALAAAAGIAIENARLYDESSRREQWLAAAAEITAALLGRVPSAGALQLVADRAREVAGADSAALLLATDDGTDLVIEVIAGAHAQDSRGTTLPVQGILEGAVMSQHPSVPVEPALHGSPAGGLRAVPGWPDGPGMLLPLRTADEVTGVLALAWFEQRHDDFQETDLALSAAFAEQAALALQVTQFQVDRARLAVFEDRDRIGRDLHDLVIQRLFAVGLTLQNASRLAERPQVAERIASAVDDIDATIKDIRRTIFELSTAPESDGLRAELGRSLEVVTPALGFAPRLRTDGPVDSAVSDAVRPHLVAVVREALSNVARHAGATAVEVSLVVGKSIELTVTDNGRGVGNITRESGLRNLRERATSLGGVFAVRSRPGKGTLLEWSVPAGATPSHSQTDEEPPGHD